MVRERLCVGVDIGASSVKLCQFRKTGKGLVLEHFGMVPLPSETVVDGALMNSARVVEALQELVARQKVKHRHAALSISGHSVIIKKIPLPHMSREELEKSIQWEAEQFIPFDMKDVYLDVQIVNEHSAQQGQMDVVLVAAKKDFVNDYTSVIIESGLEPVVCDVDAFAIETMFLANYDKPVDETVLLVNVGASKTNINILVGGVSSFTRDLSLGGNNFTEEIQKQLGIRQEEAEDVKLGKAPSAALADVERALNTVAEHLTNDIQRSIDFHGATSADQQPTNVYLSGGSARLPTLMKAIQARTGIPVVIVDPFRRILPGTYDAGYLAGIAPMAAVAVGLALRFPGDSG